MATTDHGSRLPAAQAEPSGQRRHRAHVQARNVATYGQAQAPWEQHEAARVLRRHHRDRIDAGPALDAFARPTVPGSPEATAAADTWDAWMAAHDEVDAFAARIAGPLLAHVAASAPATPAPDPITTAPTTGPARTALPPAAQPPVLAARATVAPVNGPTATG